MIYCYQTLTNQNRLSLSPGWLLLPPPVLCACVYRPPNSDLKLFLEEFNVLLFNLKKAGPSGSNLVVAGDFNINLLNNDTHGRDLLTLLTSFCLYPTIFRPTRPDSNTLLDNIFVDYTSVSFNSVLSVKISDHLPILTKTKINYGPNVVTRPLSRLFTQGNITKFHRKLELENWDSTYQCHDADQANELFMNTFLALFNECFTLEPQSSVKKRRKAWITNGLVISSINKSKLYKQFLSGQVDRLPYVNYRNKYVSLLRLAKRKYFTDFFTLHKKNTRETWKMINSFSSKQARAELHSVQPDQLNDFFATLGSGTLAGLPNTNLETSIKYINFNRDSFYLTDTSLNEVINVCLKLPAKTSCGLDEISTKLLHSVIDLISDPLAHIINLSFNTGTYPFSWKIAKVVPVFKSGDANLPINFRPISVLSAFSKITERLMCIRMSAFISSKHLLSNSQYGFRKGRCTEQAVANLVNLVSENLDNAVDVFAMYVDVAKAFDSIDISILLCKLHAYGFRGTAHLWFKNYLRNRCQYVEKGSAFKCLTHGVPQGSILGPILFLLYINDLPSISRNTHFILFADDTTALIPISNAYAIQNECDKIFDWFRDNRLQLNVTKTKCMLFTLSRHRINPLVLAENKPLDYVSSFRFLGCLIDCRLSWNDHVNNVCMCISKGIAMLHATKSLFPFYVKRLIYFACIYPYLTYCLTSWGSATNNLKSCILLLQKRALRLVAGADFLSHSKPIAYKFGFLLLDELYSYLCCIEMFSYIHNLPSAIIPANLNCTQPTRRPSRTSNNLYVPYSRTLLRQRSLSVHALKLWNKLPTTLMNISSIYVFKTRLKNRLITQYRT